MRAPLKTKNTATTEQRHRETIELLLGTSAIILFGIALVIWPAFGYFIVDVAHSVRDKLRF